ncbi:MAG: putative polysaccharide deacetylase [Frankiales bacterium]|nr:putative polysaccharide deacetylase [Frankiales bacterium]
MSTSLTAPRLGAVLPGPRSWLRARPWLQGLLVAPGGLPHDLPHGVGGIYVLLYHGVEASHVAGLRSHLEALVDRGRFLSWDDVVTAVQEPESIPAGPLFCLSFDDGHKEWVDRVLPLLQEHNLPATFFLATDRVVTGTSRTSLTWRDCAELVGAGMAIGSHTVTHRRLTGLSDAEASYELTGSKEIIEQRLGLQVRDFSYPFGLPGLDYTARHREMASAAGYRSAASALPGRMERGHSVFDLRRCGLSPAWPVLAMRKRVHE